MYTFQDFYIPEYMMEGLSNWKLYGIRPGSFLLSVLKNDLRNACENADRENIHNLPTYIAYLYNEAPEGCWGSREKVDRWEVYKLAERKAKEEFMTTGLPGVSEVAPGANDATGSSQL